ncbi:hypothetical protein [Nocardia sp. NPDC003979]
MRSPTDQTAGIRGVSVGAASGAVAVLAHGLGGASGVPASSSLVLLFAACALVGVVAGTFPRGAHAVSTMAVLAVGQYVGHTALSLGPGHSHHGVTVAMVIAHLVAIPLGALAIRGAEVGLGRAISSVCRLVIALVGVVGVPSRPTVPVPDAERAIVRQLLRRPVISLRGPPRHGLRASHPAPV